MSGRIKQLLDAGQIVRTMHLGQLPSPKLIEVAAVVGGVDGIWIDQEHCDISTADLEILLVACRAAGMDAFARVAPTDYATIMRPMEAGCSGVMVAQIRTLDQVHASVKWANFPPLGERGVYPGNFEGAWGTVDLASHVARANRDRWLAIQIETTEAVEIVDQIVAVSGVDWLFVGPADLSVTLGVPGQYDHPDFLAALRRVSAACRAAGKPWGTLCRDVAYAEQARDLGCQLFSIYGDLGSFAIGLAADRDRFAEVLQSGG
ncbi:MAG: aldolase [Planctomycetales bacterium]|nr:aldolase [Planctomycetales bacterium]NIN07509.1 aldolase [Planctomycetales bacterium]NIN76613.1 aldolase [Planctomycetales bacterium]NIO33803.1 aldolase [Planctomycetales bacterium]NIO45621.1 aldolase [Planctomycetales bacterium]